MWWWWWWWLTLKQNKEKRERERRKKVSYLFPFASPQCSSFLQFKIFLTLAGSVEARAGKGWAVKRALRISFHV